MILNKEKNNLSKSFLESIDTGSASEIVVDKEIFITIHQNNTDNLQKFNKEVSKDFIQFHFCLKGSSELVYNEGAYKLNLTKDKILENFFNKEFFCYMTGFIAGMPFLGDLDENMRVERLETPRVKVPKGSVGITEQFADIYTFESPGGWNIIGNTPLEVFDSSKEIDPNLINPGDTVKFKQITLEEYKNYNE